MRHIARFLRFSVRDRRADLRGRRLRRPALMIWKYQQDLPGLHAAAELRAAGDDPRPRGRRQPARRICARAAPLPALGRHPAAGQAGLHLGRGQEFLHPQRRRFRRRSARAVGVLVQGNKRAQGASTITQQVAKNFLLTNERSFTRKIREALLAFRIESAYSKEKILELYLNEIYLGLGNYGVAAAALNYFDKSVNELSVAEVAYLAALPKAPNNYQPFLKRDRAIERRNWVIDRMVENGYVPRPDGDKAKLEPLGVNPRVLSPDTYAAGYFAEEVRRELSERYGEKKLYEGGLSVRTTLDPKMQVMARKALVDGLVRYDEAHGWRGAIRHIEFGGDWGAALGRSARPSATCSPGASPSCSTRRRHARRGSACSRAATRPARSLADRETGQLTLEGTRWTGKKSIARADAARRRRLCRADGRQARAVQAAAGARTSPAPSWPWTPIRAASSPWWAASRSTSPSSTAPPRRCASRAPRSSPSSMRRRSTTATRRPRWCSTRRSRSTWARAGHLAPGQRRRRGLRAAYAALRHRAFAQPDDGAARQGHRHAADRRICQAVRHLRRHAAGALHVARARARPPCCAWSRPIRCWPTAASASSRR